MARLHVANIDAAVDESMLYELMIQAAPVVSVKIPRKKGADYNYGFVEFASPEDAKYAVKVFSRIRLFNRTLRLSTDGAGSYNVTASSEAFVPRLFVGNLDPDLVDETALALPFQTIGQVRKSEIAYDENGRSKGYGFVVMESFSAADKAISAMDKQFLMNRPCHVAYARKDGTYESHGANAERTLEALQSRED